MEHTAQCIENSQKHAVIVLEYVTEWPNHCKSCNGWGGKEYHYDPSPSGVSLSPGYMTDWNVCQDCIEQGICPRCGKEVWDENSFDDYPVSCPECGYIENETEGTPSPPECYCWQFDPRDEYLPF